MSKPKFKDAHLDYYEPICRLITKAVFAPYLIVEDNPNERAVDQILYSSDGMGNKQGIYGYLELEYVDADRFSSDKYISHKEHGISIPERKEKHFHMERYCWYLNFSRDMSHYISLRSDFILSNYHWSKYPVYNNNVPEQFMIVPNEIPETREFTKEIPIAPNITAWAIAEINRRCHIPGKKLIRL